MPTMHRRQFVASGLATALSLKALAQGSSAVPLRLGTGKPVAVPPNFVGLSYETQQLSEPAFFSPANKPLIERFRELSPKGVLRLGGNTSDYGFWKPTPSSVAPPRARREYKVGDPPPDLTYAVTPEAVRNLRGFLDAADWTCLYGINFGTNTPALAAEEAAFATQTLGPKLEYIQIGNEADRFATTIRDPKVTGHPWNADVFVDEWLTFAKAILARVPNARFGMPDIASNAEWFSTISERLASDPVRAHIACMTHHYYIGGPPSNPEMTIEHILQRNPVVTRDAALVRAAAEKLGTSWRMTEGNTCYRGGKPGVSDVFAAALWAADYMLELAALGYSGVNLHGGDGQMVANSLGGKLPGDDMVTGDPASHPHPYYTPIAHIGDRYVAEPVSFGMRFAQHFAGSELAEIDLQTGGANVAAYAGRKTGVLLLGVINKQADRPFTFRFDAADVHSQPELELTSAPSLSSADVKITRPAPGSGSTQTVPPASLALFTFRM